MWSAIVANEPGDKITPLKKTHNNNNNNNYNNNNNNNNNNDNNDNNDNNNLWCRQCEYLVVTSG